MGLVPWIDLRAVIVSLWRCCGVAAFLRYKMYLSSLAPSHIKTLFALI